MSNQYKQEEISDDEGVDQTSQKSSPVTTQKEEKIEKQSPHKNKNQSPRSQDIQQQHKEPEYQDQRNEHGVMQTEEKKQQKQLKINHQEIGKYANISMELEDQEKGEINLKIIGNETKGSALSKYTAYVIKGYDKNGEVSTCRRFSQFHALRTALVKRWPGCFIPSIPNKNYMMKNDKEEVIKRERYLNDFLHKMARLPHLYYSEEFQAFVKSQQSDVSKLFDAWPTPSTQSIIAKYRQCFGALAGKEINQQTNDIVTQFYSKVKKNQPLFQKYRFHAKNLAISKDKLNQSLPKVFDHVFPSYERILLAEYTNNDESKMVYLNSQQVKLAEQASIVHDVCRKNPYWILYDLLKHEERDGKAFMESFSAIESIENKKNSLDSKIKENQKSITELAEGKKKNTSAKSNEELKYKLQVENQQIKKQRDLLWTLMDIISALIVFIEIPTYKQSKVQFYENTLRKIGGYQINAMQICAEVWSNTSFSSKKISSENQSNL